jgi:two-component system, chemotaxis family, protein-glutamate methylesterase/glutaminase
MDKIIRVLIVDDSAYIRKVVKQMLSRSPFIEVVGTAHDGSDALELIEQLHPDVITLDLIMPEMDGVEFLKRQMARKPIPTIIVSIADEGGEKVLAALDAGAVDFVHKPTALANNTILEISEELVSKVKTAASVTLEHLPNFNQTITNTVKTPVQRITGAKVIDFIAIGISTGGPQALAYLIPQIPADFPIPIGVVLHMPVGYTQMYASRLNAMSQLNVVEAQAGEEVTPGKVLIAPAGRHLMFKRHLDGIVRTRLEAKPFDTLHRPSVDVMFESAAQVYGDRTLGIVMTGMGSDGKQGAAWIKSKGGRIFTEAESSCIVYGMPRSVVEAGFSDRTVPLEEMITAILTLV